eukprot:537561_1
MPSRKSPKKSRKRKHAEIQEDSENEESSLQPVQNPKRRRITSPKSSQTQKQKSKPSPSITKSRKSPVKSPKKSQKSSKQERDSDDSSSSSDYDQVSLNLANATQSQSQSQSQRKSPRNRNSRNKNHKPLQQKRVSPKRRKRKRVSVSQSQSQRTLRSHSQRNQSQSQSIAVDEEEEEEFALVQHNERVMEMYKWLTTSRSWMEIKNTLQTWVSEESDSQDTENYAELTLDIINLMLYCGGVRVFKLDDIDDLDIESLTAKEKEDLAFKLQQALIVDHEDIEAIPAEMESDEDINEEEAHSEEEEKAEEDGKKSKKSKKKEGEAARTEAERVLEFDVMLWRNGSAKQQNSFKSRYGQLMQRIGQIFETSIFENDDYIMTCILNWCEFFARSFQLTQFRKLGTWTVFSLCDPLIRSMAKNRKPMEKIKEQLEREKISQRNVNKSTTQRRSPRKSKKKKNKIEWTDKMNKWKENIEEYENRIDNLDTHVTFMFEKIGAYKAGDSNESIRCMVLHHIVKWINIDPSTDSFLSNKYYQYLLYGLQDKRSSKVRETALIELMELFDYEHKFHGKQKKKKKKKKKKKESVVGESDKLDASRKVVLEPFWERMRGTIECLLADKSESVVSRCIEFVNILLRGDMLGPEDGDCILNYIFDESDEIRAVAAKFIFYDTFDEQAVLKSHVFDDDDEEEKKEIRIKDQVKMKDDIIEIVQLMKDRVVDLNIKTRQLLDGAANVEENALYRNYVQVADYIVQSMKNELNVLREWEIMFRILRDADRDKGREEMQTEADEMNIKHEIDDEGQTMLCYLILSCVKCVANKLDTECRNVVVKRGRKSKQNEEQIRTAAMNELKQCVVPHLAVLLDIYQADVFKLYPLIQIIYLIPIDAFDGVKNKRYLDEILNSLKVIFVRHDTPFVSNKNDQMTQSTTDDDDELNITEDMSDDEVRQMEFKIRNKELKELHQCIKTRIDSEMVFEIAKCFSFLCDKEYQFREHCGRFVFDMVTQITDEFDDIVNSIENKLSAGHDLSTLDALLAAEDTSSFNLLQSLYSNLHKQYSLKCTHDIGTIQFTNAMHDLLRNIYDDLIFDGSQCEISTVLYRLLSTAISRTVHQLNFTSPDMAKMHDLAQHKEELVQLFKYYVKQDGGSLPVLDTIASMMETLCYFRGMKNQSQLLDHTLNNASFIEMEPVDAASFNEIAILKQDLLGICERMLGSPVCEDPYDPSSHTTRENIQIRYLIGAARLCLINPTYYEQFGATILSFYCKPNEEMKFVKSRRDEIIRRIAHQLMEQHPTQFEQMLFEAIKRMKRTNINRKQIEKITKSVAMMKGLGRNTQKRKSWSVFTKLMLDWICGHPDNVPSHFVFLHCLTFFLRHFTNRDKLEIWAHFQSLSRKLPPQQDGDKDWDLYHQFKLKLKTEADKAQRNRNLALNEEDLENLDLNNNQSGSIHVAEEAMEEINLGVQVDDEEEEEEEHERVAVAISNINIDDTTRVSVAKSNVQQQTMDVDDDAEHKEEEEAETLSPPRRGGLGNKNKKRKNTSSSKHQRKSPAGTWLKRIK